MDNADFKIKETINLEHTVDRKEKAGTPDRTRTCDLLIRSQTLYPAELRAHISVYSICSVYSFVPSFPPVLLILLREKTFLNIA